jgi:exodeoxyribonuclease III
MKITTFNVNGIRAALKKGVRDWALSEKPDVFCVQEIKARPEQLPPDLRIWPGYFRIGIRLTGLATAESLLSPVH